MKESPLLVSTPLIQPIIQDWKIETRRLSNLDIINRNPDDYEFYGVEGIKFNFRRKSTTEIFFWKCPYGGPGDLIWVRENWYVGKTFDHVKPRELATDALRGYTADGEKPEWAGRTRPSIHMPRGFSRITLKILSTSVQRLWQITEKDAEREGVDRGILRDGPNTEKGQFQLELTCNGSPLGFYREGFQYTWMTLNGRKSWESNPWVWVVKFKRMQDERQ